MPERKKPASSRSGSPARSGLRKPPRRATAVGGARRSAEPRPKKIQPRKPSLRRKPVQEQPEVEVVADETVAEATLRAEERPVAIAGQTPASEVPAVAFGEAAYPGGPGLLPEVSEAAPAPADTERPASYPQDWLVAALSLVLAATVFLPWYRFLVQTPRGQQSVGLSGWETGTWGPLVGFLALGSFALAVTRLLRIRVSLPLPHPTIHEGVGWIAIFSVLIKRLVRPGIPQGGFASRPADQTWWILAPILVGLALAFIAGRMTGGPPLVVLPGWRRGRAGLIGLVLVGVVVLGGAGMGYLNAKGLDEVIADKQSAALGGARGSRGGAPTGPTPLTNRFPKCASGLPSPPEAKPETGFEQSATTPCIWVMHSPRKPEEVLAFYKDTLPKNGYKVAVQPASAAGSTVGFSGPRCGNISITSAVQGKKGARIAVFLAPCATGKATPRASSSPR